MSKHALILFDLNGVLYRYDRDARIATLALRSGRDAVDIQAAIWGSGYEDSGDSGSLDADAYLRGFGAQLGAPLSEADWVAALVASIAPIPRTLALLPRFRPGVACAVLTNNNLLVRRNFSTLYPEVAKQVGDRAFVSAEFGARKPNPEVYRKCLTGLGVAPDAALFVDDNEDNVAGAIDAGLAGFHVTSPDLLIGFLTAEGLLV